MMFYFDKVVLVEIQHRTFKHRIFFLIASQCKTIACYYNEVQMPCNGFCGCAENSCENNFNEQVLENEENEDDGEIMDLLKIMKLMFTLWTTTIMTFDGYVQIYHVILHLFLRVYLYKLCCCENFPCK